MARNPTPSLEEKATTEGNPTASEDAATRPLEDRRRLRFHHRVLVLAISVFSSITRWALVHTTNSRPRRTTHWKSRDPVPAPHTAARAEVAVATAHQPHPPLTVVDDPQQLPAGNPIGPLTAVEASGRFIRDSGLGRALHPGKGKISYRQAVRENSLHLVIDGKRVTAHINRLSPLAFDDHGNAYYSLRRAVRYSSDGPWPTTSPAWPTSPGP